ncbi:MAG: hypothetical protein IPI10_18540 [Bacteroidetes bacterium]|nr:hypothetical protein [Bacteroidota bacterium]
MVILCDYKIEVFRNNIPDSSGYGEGEFYIGDAIYTTDSLGFAVFQFPVTSVNSDYYSLTATSLITGNTSVFSNIGDSTVSLNEVDRGGVNVFPNPSNSSFNIISNKIVSLNVYDLCENLFCQKQNVMERFRSERTYLQEVIFWKYSMSRKERLSSSSNRNSIRFI